MNKDYNFEQKNFAVIGASSGIGRQCAIDLTELGANVLAVGRNAERLQALRQTNPAKIFTAQLDVTTATTEDWENMFDSFINSFGRLHGGIYTAGIWGLTPLNGYDADFAHKIFDTSLKKIYALDVIFCCFKFSCGRLSQQRLIRVFCG